MGGNTPDTDEGACRCRRHRAVCRGKRNVCTNPGSRHCSASDSQRLCQRDCRGCSWAHSSWQSWEWVTFLASSGFYCPACTCASWHTVQLDQNRQICIDFIQSVYTQHTHMYGCAYASVPGQNAAMDQLHILNGSQLPGSIAEVCMAACLGVYGLVKFCSRQPQLCMQGDHRDHIWRSAVFRLFRPSLTHRYCDRDCSCYCLCQLVCQYIANINICRGPFSR